MNVPTDYVVITCVSSEEKVWVKNNSALFRKKLNHQCYMYLGDEYLKVLELTKMVGELPFYAILEIGLWTSPTTSHLNFPKYECL